MTNALAIHKNWKKWFVLYLHIQPKVWFSVRAKKEAGRSRRWLLKRPNSAEIVDKPTLTVFSLVNITFKCCFILIAKSQSNVTINAFTFHNFHFQWTWKWHDKYIFFRNFLYENSAERNEVLNLPELSCGIKVTMYRYKTGCSKMIFRTKS